MILPSEGSIRPRPAIQTAWIRGSLFCAALTCAGLTGCIRSRVTITSEPSQAEVVWRGEHRGVTPITIPFIWYWYQDFTIEKDGYEKMEVVERLRTPPWFLMPLDLFMEIIPIPIPDERERHYVLKKKEEEKTF